MRKLLLLLALCCLSLWSCTEKKSGDPFATIKPEESRFTKIPLVEGLNEPMELEVLDNGDVLFIERNGKLKLYQAASSETIEVGELEVYPDGEDGLLGLAKDPNFTTNNWIYLYYAPVGGASINRLSRFDFKENLLDKSSEKIMLEVPVFRGCCHSGGSLEFDGKGNLYLSMGDDTTPFESDNYNPIDERAGRPENVDAQRSSGNSNDLRGSIIRIKPEVDGSYSIPEGNLWPVGTPNTRPEIYVKGNRNPYRIAIDQRNGNLFWGEVGPDAAVDSLRRGPKGHDEINLATKAGFFGWPYFVGNNKPYWKYDFEKQESIFEFDPMAPKNTSPNNTGIEILPPATSALIWYPYGPSEEFPMLDEGGRNAMAGPVYYREDYEKSEVRFPGYYDGKVFIYDWMRNWIFTVSLTENYEYDTMERFMPSTVFDKPVDMQFAKDGSLYMLEYGTYWRAQNDDAGLYRIVFAEGNRAPQVKISADNKVGAAPLQVKFSSEGTLDLDTDDAITFEWDFGTGAAKSQETNPSFTFEKAGTYQVKLIAKDKSGESSKATLEIKVGNEAPVVQINWNGNRSFYFGNEAIDYALNVSDREDAKIDQSQLDLTITYLEGYDLIKVGHEEEILSIGETYINQAGCKACHAIANESVGPDYTAVSEKYKGDANAQVYLANKIKNGGGGVWGERVMPGHTHLEDRQISEMVDFILGIADPDRGGKLPATGTYQLKNTAQAEGYYLVQASYTDQGANGISPLKTTTQLTIRNPKVMASNVDELKDAARANGENVSFVKYTANNSWVMLRDIDLNQIKKITLEIDPTNTGGKLELRTGSPDGKLLAVTKTLTKTDRPKGRDGGWFTVEMTIEQTDLMGDIYLVFKAEQEVSIWNTFQLNSLKFNR
jgi:cytochrome c